MATGKHGQDKVARNDEGDQLAGKFVADSYDDFDGFSEGSEELELRDLEDDSRTGPVATLDSSGGLPGAGKDSGDHCRDVSLFNEDANEEEIGSEEENEILKGIRDEIENKVREEMAGELADMKQRIKAIENGELPSQPQDGEESNRVDPKMKEALTKMNKLDKILKKKVKKERQVKRDRLLLERRMREEIDSLQHGVSHYREIKVNTERFLALAPPPSHNEGIKIDEEEEEEAPPLFSTQIYDVEGLFDKKKSQNLGSGDIEEDENEADDHTGESVSGDTRSCTRNSRKGGKGKKPKKDFIKRNKELAADADQLVAMTDDEKKRLQDLLGDVDEFEDGQESGLPLEESYQGSAFQVSLLAGEGFRPDNTEQKSLTNIDQRLRSIMPEENYRSMVSSSFNTSAASQPPMFNHLPFTTGGEIPERFGEKVLYETKEERELKAKLESIEERLDKFKSQDSETEGQGHLTDAQLDNLLDQCVRDLSRMSHTAFTDTLDTPDLSARSVLSSRQSLSQMENLPRLTDSQLQQLLSEAHFPLSSTLRDLRDDDQKIEEERGNTEKIDAETWKAIKEEDLESEKLIQDAMAAMDNVRGNISQNASSDFGRDSRVTESFDSDRMMVDGEEVLGGSDSTKLNLRLSSRNSTTRESLPKINPNMSAWASFSSENTPVPPVSVTPTSSVSTLQDSGDPLRLPDIHSNSFLIQAPQGMNNDGRKTGDNLSSRKPIHRLHNDLTESVSSVDEAEVFNAVRLSNQAGPQFNPRPPSKDSPHSSRTSARP